MQVKTLSTSAAREIHCSKQGVYNAPLLLPGKYSIEVSAPGFVTATRNVIVSAGSRIREDFQLQAGNSSSNSVSSGPLLKNTETQTEGEMLAQGDIRKLPNLTRDVYRFASLAGNLSDAGLGTRGAGFAANGLRESSTNILFDGGGNNNLFSGSIGQQIPLDAVQELSVFTNGFGAEYGRASGAIVSVVSKVGSNSLHGTGYEFNRISQLTSNTYKDNANGVHQPDFNRNQFGYSVGAPIIRNKLFLFSSTEGLYVRSNATNFAWVPSAQLLAETAPNTQSFFQTLGQLRSGARTVGTVTLNDLTAIYGRNPCTGLACATLPSGLPLFSHVAYSVPADAGGGFPQNTWNTLQRLDYNASDRTRIYARYSLYKENDPAGVLSSSPYDDYDLGQNQLNNALVVSGTRTWSGSLISQTKVDLERLTIRQQGLTNRGLVPSMYANPLSLVAIGNDKIAFPGYNPFSPGSGGAFGGPQNVLEFHHDMSWTKGRHLIRVGGSYDYIQDNRTDAAYQTAVDSLSNGGGLGTAVNGLLAGRFTQIIVAVNPQGKFPCPAGVTNASCTLTTPLNAPAFSRSNRFNEGALYAQDYWTFRRRFAVNLGVRWEHFGVQHNNNANLDSNWYANNVGFADNNLGAYLRNGGLQLASKSSIGQLWKPDWKDFAPRIGFAWDVFGDGRTSLRGGYGIAYERNFGNVTFNVIQNLPNYAVLEVPGPVTTSNFGPLANGGSILLPQVGARIVDPNIKTAYAHFWSASIQRAITHGIFYSAGYSGSKGESLYSISYPNQFGFGNFALGDPCTGNGDCLSQPNPNYGEDVGYRGNQGFSIYHSLNSRLTMNNFLNLGIALTANYTWSHAIDNMSSTFFEAGGQGVASQFGNQNITINNGNFSAGLLDPYHPNLDRGDAEFDVRHRVTLTGNWTVPAGSSAGWMKPLTHGWSLNPIFTARSGQPFSVFNSSTQTLDFNAPRATFIGKVPSKRNTYAVGTAPDTFQIFRFLATQIASTPNFLTPKSQWPANMSGRDAFRAPGFWNLDLGITKDTRLTERLMLQLRAESFNIFNHANLYVIGTTADVGRSNTVDACYGCTGSTYDRRQVQLAAKLIF